MSFMIPKSAKAKGRKLQQFVRDALRSAFGRSLEDGDIESQLMGGSGEDIVMSPLAKKKIPFSFECKNVERLNLWGSLKQAEENCEDRTPVLVVTKNRTPVYCVVPFETFIDLIKEGEIEEK